MKEEFPWRPTDFLAIANNKIIVAWSYGRKKALENAIISGFHDSWIISASSLNRKYEFSEEIGDKVKLYRLNRKREKLTEEINILEKKIKKDYKY